MNRTEYKNQHQKDNYDRINFCIPKGEKAKIQNIANRMNISVSEYLYMLVCEDLSTGTSKLAEKKKGFTPQHQELLNKWQIAKKYHEMIEDMSYSKEDGYFIYLKKGYINDITNSRNIHCQKTSELRNIINKSHKK